MTAVDLELKNVAAAVGVTNALNQIVYSPGSVFATTPKGLKPVDQNLLKFVKNSLDYFANSFYFYHCVPYTLFSGTFPYVACNNGMYGIDNTWFPSCSFGVQYFSAVLPDYRVFSRQAMGIWTNEEELLLGHISYSTSIARADAASEDAIGVEIGGWPMEEELGSTGEHTDPDTRRGLEIFWAILGIGRANAQEADPDGAPAQDPRAPGTVYITSRVVAGGWSRHAALECICGTSTYKTISAFDSDTSRLNDETLISEKDWPSDAPHLMMETGTVTPPRRYDERQLLVPVARS